MVYVRLDEKNIIVGYYTVKIHGKSKCDEIIENGGIVISPSIWSTISKWHKAKFVGISKEEYITSIFEFEEIKEVINIPPPQKTQIEILEEKVQVLTEEKESLEAVNIMQDEMINISMMATDEIFIMIEPLLGSTLNINSSEGREGKSSMVDMYVAMVQRGLKTIDEVPARYREQVKSILAELEK